MEVGAGIIHVQGSENAERKKEVHKLDLRSSMILTNLAVAKTLERVNAKIVPQQLLFSRLRVHFRTCMSLFLAISII